MTLIKGMTIIIKEATYTDIKPWIKTPFIKLTRLFAEEFISPKHMNPDINNDKNNVINIKHTPTP